MIGFDYTDRIAPAELRAAGCSVVFRYTTWSGWGKSLTPGEADELHAAGIPIAANFESTADRMKGGAAAGRADALEARGHLGDDHMPTGLKIWFSADWDVQPGDVSLVLDYLHAAADALGSKDLVGLYGGLRAVKAAADAGFSIWQTIAWSGGQWDPRAVARQTGEQRTVGGVQVDVNEILDLAGLGAWGGPVPAPAPTTTPTSTEDDMSIATGTIAPGVGVTTVVLPPPANSGAAGWGNVWFSLGADNAGNGPADAHVRIAAFRGGVWTDFHLDFVVKSAGPRVLPLGSPLPTDVEKISITRLAGSENVPLSYLVEAVKK